MTFIWPRMLGALVLVPVFVAGYVAVQRRRARRVAALAASGLAVTGGGRLGRRRHVPFALLIGALAVMTFALARPEATLATSRPTGTVMLVFDVSNSMNATDVEPSRLVAAQQAAQAFVKAQPSTIEIGVVAFGNGALATQQPTADRAAVLAAIGRLKTGGSTSLGQGMLLALSTIAGKPVELADPQDATPPSIGYFGSATMILLSDGENTSSPDPAAVAQLAATAGVHVSAIGVGTPAGAVIEVDGYQVATALDEAQLQAIASATNGTYEPASDAATLDTLYRSIDLRIKTVSRHTEITAVLGLAAIALMGAAGLLTVRWYGRVI